MRLNKKIFSATVMIVVLSLVLNLIAFASPLDGGGTFESSRPSNGTQMPYSSIDVDAFKTGYDAVRNLGTLNSYTGFPAVVGGGPAPSGFTDGIDFWIKFPDNTQSSLSAGYTFVVDFGLDISGCSSAEIGAFWYGDLVSATTPYPRYRMTVESTTEYVDGTAFIRGKAFVTMPEWGAYPLVIGRINTDNIDYAFLRVYDIYYISPEQQIVGGWSDSEMVGSNNQLGGALGNLDDMQQDADNDLHDALGDLESPTVDFNGNAVSFITSSVSMLWGSLGGFSAVLLCALFITVFNFISRYRGS